MPAATATRSWVEFEVCSRSFLYFTKFWHFKDRETGRVMTWRPPGSPCPMRDGVCKCQPADLWEGQRELADVYSRYDWVFALKAGKLGFTELECAFDAWSLLFRHANARVHLFSKDDAASRNLLRYVRFGLVRLPSGWGVELMKKAGGQTQKSLILRHKWCDPDDEREVVSYPATGQVAIDQTATHSHVDELSHMANAEALWNSVSTTVSPAGTCHIVTRGAGDAVYSAELWEAATSAPEDQRGFNSILFPFFSPYDRRPDRNAQTREQLANSGTMTLLGLSYFLPETAEDALRGDEESPYIPLDRWDQLFDPDMPPLLPGSRDAIVISLDAAVTNDCFAATAISRHWDPERRGTDAAIRRSKKWSPEDFPPDPDTGIRRIDFDVCEQWVRLICSGGCPDGHARVRDPKPGCQFCDRGEWSIKPFNVVQLTYDPYQLEDMAQRLKRDGVVWCSPFDQGSERLVGDGMMYRMAMNGRLSHNGDPDVREHIGNAKAKLQPDEESKMRMIKKSPSRKIDLAVSAAMGIKRCMDLNL